MEVLNIIICGVGGQGNVLLEQIIGQSAMEEGYQVRAADTFGATQRGGSVLSHLRLGHEVNSCLIPWGRCDIILGLEPSEAVRTASTFLIENGLVVVNTSPVLPPKVKSGEQNYPSFEIMLSLLRQLTQNIIHLDATTLAKENATERAMNVVMLGVLIGSGAVPMNPGMVKQVMLKRVGASLAQVNAQAFDTGFEIGKQKQATELEK